MTPRINTLAIDTGIEPEYENRLIASAKEIGWRVIYPTRVPFTSEILDVKREDLCNPGVWYHGDIETAKVIQTTLPWQVHAPWDYLDLANLISHVRSWDELPVLNAERYLITTAAEFRKNYQVFFDQLAEDDHVFVRSTAADKTISGRCIERSDFVRQWDLLTFYDPDPRTRLLVSHPRKIHSEARFLVFGKKIVTGSHYKTGKSVVYLEATEELRATAHALLEKLHRHGYQPPSPSWVLDLAETERGWEILEVGATSCCGLYACDTDALVKALSEDSG